MTAAGVLASVRSAGIVLSVSSGQLHWRGPRGAMSEVLLAKLDVLRDQVLELLKTERKVAVGRRLRETWARLNPGGRRTKEQLQPELAHQMALEVGRYVAGDVAELDQLEAAIARWEAAVLEATPAEPTTETPPAASSRS